MKIKNIILGFAVLILCSCDRNTTLVNKERIEKSFNEITIVESGIFKDQYYIIFLDEKSNTRILYFSDAMVVLPD